MPLSSKAATALATRMNSGNPDRAEMAFYPEVRLWDTVCGVLITLN
jgi:hypothetical protein